MSEETPLENGSLPTPSSRNLSVGLTVLFLTFSLHYGFYNPEITCQESNDHICIEGCEQLYLFRNPNFIKEAIGDGWYIYTDADMFYIGGNPFFKRTHFTHDMMIYGYDEDNVYIYMYDDNKLSSHTVRYDN